MSIAWLASVAIALGFIALVLLGTRLVLRRRGANIDTVAWILIASIAGGSMSALALALI